MQTAIGNLPYLFHSICSYTCNQEGSKALIFGQTHQDNLKNIRSWARPESDLPP